MKILVTAGSTEVDIDCVRQIRAEDGSDYDLSIGNSFRGATGLEIARFLQFRGHSVTLLTSDKDIQTRYGALSIGRIIFFRTYNELADTMEREITSGAYDVVVHSAAVSDFSVAGMFVMNDGLLVPLDNTGKISSSHPRIYAELVPTDKLIDKIRIPWGFAGKLVKFKLQSGITDDALVEIAKASLLTSRADIIVANCREWYKKRAYIIDSRGSVTHVIRSLLADELARRLVS